MTVAVDMTSVPRRHPRVSARVVNGTALVVVLDRRELHRLNRVGARIWELCDGRSLGDIRERIASEYDAAEATIDADLRAFVDQLQQLGALSLEPSRPPEPAESDLSGGTTT